MDARRQHFFFIVAVPMNALHVLLGFVLDGAQDGVYCACSVATHPLTVWFASHVPNFGVMLGAFPSDVVRAAVTSEEYIL